jgi:hypothetical protein
MGRLGCGIKVMSGASRGEPWLASSPRFRSSIKDHEDGQPHSAFTDPFIRAGFEPLTEKGVLVDAGALRLDIRGLCGYST